MRPGNSSVGTPLASLPLPPRMTGVVSGAKLPVSGSLATSAPLTYSRTMAPS